MISTTMIRRPRQEQQEILRETFTEVTSAVVKGILLDYLIPYDLAVYDDPIIFNEGIVSRGDSQIALEAVRNESYKILSQMIPHLKTDDYSCEVVCYLINFNRLDLIKLFSRDFCFDVEMLFLCQNFNNLNIFKYILTRVPSVCKFQFEMMAFKCVFNPELIRGVETPEFLEFVLSLYNFNIAEIFHFPNVVTVCTNVDVILTLVDKETKKKNLNINYVLNNRSINKNDKLKVLEQMYHRGNGYADDSSMGLAIECDSFDIVECVHRKFLCGTLKMKVLRTAMIMENDYESYEMFKVIKYFFEKRFRFDCYGDYGMYCSERVFELMKSVKSECYGTTYDRVNELCKMIEDDRLVKEFKEKKSVNVIVEWAVREGRLDMVKYANEKYMSFGSSEFILTAAYNNQIDVLKYLIEERIDYERNDIEMALMVAKGNGYVEMEKYLGVSV